MSPDVQSQMSPTRQLARAARERLWRSDLLARLGPSLFTGLGAGLLLLVAVRALGYAWPAWALVSTPTLLAAAWALIVSLIRRRSVIEAASEVDTSLGLHDRLSSALALESQTPREPFVQLAQRDADSIAQRVRLKDIAPQRFNAWWLAWPVMGAMAVSAAIFMPVLHITSGAKAKARHVETAAEIQRSAQDIKEAAETVDELLADKPADLRSDDNRAMLDTIARELAESKVEPDEARSKAATALDSLADNLASSADQSQRELDALQRRFAGLQAPGDDDSSLTDALKQGDYEQAQRAIDQLQQAISEMDDAQRQRLADRFDHLADALADQPATDEKARDRALDALRDLGLSRDDAQRLADEADADRIRRELEDKGVDPEIADRAAKEAADNTRQRQAQEQADRDAQELQEAIRKLADQTRSDQPEDDKADKPRQNKQRQTTPEAGPKPGSQPSAKSPEPAANQENEDASQPSDASQNESDESSDQSQQDPASDEPSQQQREGATDNSDSSPAEQGQERGQGQKQGEQQGQRQDPSGAERSDDSSSTGQRDQGEPSGESTDEPASESAENDAAGEPRKQAVPDATGDGQPSQTPQPSPDSQQNEQPGATPGAQPAPGQQRDADGQNENQQEPDGASPTGFERLRKKLQELKQRRDQADDAQQDSERLREKARKLWDNMSPEERQRTRRWAQRLAKEQGQDQGASDAKTLPLSLTRPPQSSPADGAPSRQDPLDIRKQSDQERVLAEWDNPDAGSPRDEAARRRDSSAKLQQAARSAERAIEDQTVPRRYHDLIRSYFKALAEQKAAPEATKTTGGDSSENTDKK